MAPYLAGRNAVLEALRAGHRVRRIIVDASVRDGDPSVREVLQAATAAHVPVDRAPRAQLNAVHPRHQGLVAEVEEFAYTPLAALKERVRSVGASALVLALDEVQDPQNLGTLLRTALAVGVTGVIMPERRAAGDPTVVRSSAGAAEHLAISLVPNLVRTLTELQAIGCWVVGLDADGPEPYDELDVNGPLVIVVGSEGHGLRRLVREKCDFIVQLPMAGPTESLNAAVAGSIVLYHVFRSRVVTGVQRTIQSK